ncbi:MAG: amidohydrolase, partial [Anaerolineae bacterium]|nr:amidohydrolase [Anaerolineae bacterium]
MTIIERVLYNGSIITLAADQPRVSALAIGGGRILAAGSDDAMLALAGAGTIRENLGGKPVIPGMIDAHIHWSLTARALRQVDIFELPD